MTKLSAGLLIYRIKANKLEVFLVHPGGPLWAHKDDWSIPKGEYTSDEQPLDAAKREFKEETGFDMPSGKMIELKPIKQPSGKIVSAWAIEGDFDAAKMKSNLFSMEWPPKSGKQQKFPEVDRGKWFDLHEAHGKIFKGQAAFLDELDELIRRRK
jgi:predicted NUDIX family NTP pyrophosphohydrolase